MTEERYNNRQIERMLDLQSEDIKKHISSAITPILIQVTRTNGRVTELELSRATQRGFNKAMSIAFSVGFAILIGLAGWALYETSTIPDRVQSSVQQALSNYDIKVIP